MSNWKLGIVLLLALIFGIPVIMLWARALQWFARFIGIVP